MPTSQWHKLYTAHVAAPPSTLFGLLADMPNYGRWLVLDITMPAVFRPLRRAIISRFDQENVRTIAAVKTYAEAHPGGVPT
jgi:hypothetical protein